MVKTLKKSARRDACVASGGANWLSLFTIDTDYGRQDVVARANGLITACKVMPIILSKKQASVFSLRGRVKLKRVAKALRRYDFKVGLGLLANDRPITYFPGRQLSKNFIFELPGGVVEKGETISTGGIREMMEELGVKAQDVLCTSRLLHTYCYDQGTHVEWTKVMLAVCVQDDLQLKPPKAEGVIPEECCCIRLDRLNAFLKKQRKAKIGVEGHIPNARNALFVA